MLHTGIALTSYLFISINFKTRRMENWCSFSTSCLIAEDRVYFWYVLSILFPSSKTMHLLSQGLLVFASFFPFSCWNYISSQLSSVLNQLGNMTSCVSKLAQISMKKKTCVDRQYLHDCLGKLSFKKTLKKGDIVH